MKEVQEFILYLLDRYQKDKLDANGNRVDDAPLVKLDKTLDTLGSDLKPKDVVCKGIEDFAKFCRVCMSENPPHTHVMLTEGFGFQLTDGTVVGLLPGVKAGIPDIVQEPAFAITHGTSLSGQNGVTSSNSIRI